jgi:hypothetical protein
MPLKWSSFACLFTPSLNCFFMNCDIFISLGSILLMADANVDTEVAPPVAAPASKGKAKPKGISSPFCLNWKFLYGIF